MTQEQAQEVLDVLASIHVSLSILAGCAVSAVMILVINGIRK